MDTNCLQTFLSGGSLGHISLEHDCQEEAKVQDNIFYIVAAVVINEKNEVLMMQEAKQSCFEKWYLPAGKMEPGENIVEASIREVKEETGLEFSPQTILCIEECGGRWVRIALTGNIIGGSLKTPEDGDEESLQACWWDVESPLVLRSKDVMLLIRRGMERHKQATGTTLRSILPSHQHHTHFVLRLIIAHYMEDQNVNILHVKKSTLEELPTIIVPYFQTSIYPSLHNVLHDAMDNIPPFTVKGVCGLEHNGTSGVDGICLNTLVSLNCENLPSVNENCYIWRNVPSSTKVFTLLRDIFENNFNIIPLVSLKLNKK